MNKINSLVGLFKKTCFLLVLWILSSNAIAATIDVNAQVGEVGCDLVDAINSANNNMAVGGCTSGAFGPDLIRLNFSAPIDEFIIDDIDNTSSSHGPNGLPRITSEINIVGYGDSKVSITRNLVGAPRFRLFEVIGPGALTLENLDIKHFFSDDNGGAIRNNGDLLKVINCRFSQNIADNGGAIENNTFGDAIIVDSLFDLNRSRDETNSGGVGGGAIRNRTGNMTISDTEFKSNRANSGAAISASNRTETSIYRSLFHFNTIEPASAGNGTKDGGAIRTTTDSTLSIYDSTISTNFATDGNGGAISAGGFESTILVINTTITNNRSKFGGGIFYSPADDISTFYIVNSIISNNNATALSNGQEIHQSGNDSTIALANSIIGHNDISTERAIAGDILIGASSIFATSDGDTPTPINKIISPQLTPQNGGSTQTHALPIGSLAINKATDGLLLDFGLFVFYVPGCRGTEISAPTPLPAFRADQRGIARPMGAACDIGSYEREVSDDCFVVKAANNNVAVFCL